MGLGSVMMGLYEVGIDNYDGVFGFFFCLLVNFPSCKLPLSIL